METNKKVIYQILNIITNKRYVGSAVDFNRRKRTHLRLLRNGIHHSNKLQNSFNKHGEDSFEFIVIEKVNDKSKLIEREQFWLDKLKPEYNMTLVAGLNSHLGLKRGEETKKKISQALTGRKLSSEHIEAMRKGLIGLKQTEEAKKTRAEACKNSESFKKSMVSKKRIEKIKKTRLENGGYIVTEEMKKRISETLKSKENYHGGHFNEIQKFDLDGNLLETYPSMISAEKLNSIPKGYLSKCLKQNKNKIKNYIWKLKKK